MTFPAAVVFGGVCGGDIGEEMLKRNIISQPAGISHVCVWSGTSAAACVWPPPTLVHPSVCLLWEYLMAVTSSSSSSSLGSAGLVGHTVTFSGRARAIGTPPQCQSRLWCVPRGLFQNLKPNICHGATRARLWLPHFPLWRIFSWHHSLNPSLRLLQKPPKAPISEILCTSPSSIVENVEQTTNDSTDPAPSYQSVYKLFIDEKEQSYTDSCRKHKYKKKKKTFTFCALKDTQWKIKAGNTDDVHQQSHDHMDLHRKLLFISFSNSGLTDEGTKVFCIKCSRC